MRDDSGLNSSARDKGNKKEMIFGCILKIEQIADSMRKRAELKIMSRFVS